MGMQQPAGLGGMGGMGGMGGLGMGSGLGGLGAGLAGGLVGGLAGLGGGAQVPKNMDNAVAGLQNGVAGLQHLLEAASRYHGDDGAQGDAAAQLQANQQLPTAKRICVEAPQMQA